MGQLPTSYWVILGLFIIVALFAQRRQREAKSQLTLATGERVRWLGLEWAEPFLEVAIIGIILWDDLMAGPSHWIAGAIGVVAGIAFGIYRARIMYVRAVPQFTAVILKRSIAETIAVLALIAVKIIGDNTKTVSGLVSLAVTAALAMVVAESFTRVTATTIRYRAESAQLALTD